MDEDHRPLTEAHRNLSAELEYLLQLDRLGPKPAFHLEDYKLRFNHETAFLDLPGVEFNQFSGGGIPTFSQG